ncbi:MAG: DUF1802 family protein [Planctomycetes bacterium]|nr:DUF1802 family protein [Planctomycetota bacterium]
MIHVALKEWSIVCDLLTEGKLTLLLRKGGIHEDEGPGVFRLEHPKFVLYPSWAHQKPMMIKPAYRERVKVMDEPAAIPFHAVGEAAKIWEVPSRAAFDALDDLHCWTSEQIDMRFNYKPDHPLYLVAVRVSKLDTPRSVVNDWKYGGCKSWVPLNAGDEVDETQAKPAMSDADFAAVVARVDGAFA